MRRTRGGNVSKGKRQLTDATFLSVIGRDTEDAEEATPDAAVVEEAVLDEAVSLHTRGVAQEQGLAPINGFVFAHYVLGTVACSGCHYELMYYKDRDALRQGFTMRCRVCQTMQTVVLDEG